MAQVYSGAYITLAATSAARGDKGFYQRRSYLHDDHNPSTVRIKRGGDWHEVYKRRSLNESMGSNNPLLQRAWVFQERLLSPRVVHFADDMLYWECLESNACEIEDAIPISEDRPAESGVDNPFDPAQRHGLRHKSPSLSRSFNARQEWCEIVERYTQGSLKRSKDKLPALQGIAKRAQIERQCAYYAGLWEESMCLDLAWYLYKRNTVHIEYRAPSWSWASSEGPVCYDFRVGIQSEASVISVSTVPVGTDPMGEVIAGTLVIRGLCLPALCKLDAGRRRHWESLHMIGKDSPIKMQWQADFEDSNLVNEDLTAVLIASDHFYAYYLVLRPTDQEKRVYQRTGLAIRRDMDMRNRQTRYDMFSGRVTERALCDKSWEGCEEYREFTII
jgi:hypothetical protein